MSVNKLYVLVRSDLSHGQQLAQACHVMADFMLHSNEIHCRCGQCTPQKIWDNETIVVLKTKNEEELSGWLEFFRNSDGVSCSYFNEPDLGGQLTAIAVHGLEVPKALKKLDLA